MYIWGTLQHFKMMLNSANYGTSLFYRPYLVLTKGSFTLKVDLRGNSSVRCALLNIRALSSLVYWLMMQLVKIWNDHRLAILNLVEISLCITWNDSNLSWILFLQKTMNIFNFRNVFLLGSCSIMYSTWILFDLWWICKATWQRKHSYPKKIC